MSNEFAQAAEHAVLLSHKAVLFIEQHQAQHLDNQQLVRRCASHMMSIGAVSYGTALSLSMHALAEVQNRHVPAYFDMSHSTSLVVRVVDPRTGNVYQLTAGDILQLAHAQHDAPNDPSHGIQLCGRSATLN